MHVLNQILAWRSLIFTSSGHYIFSASFQSCHSDTFSSLSTGVLLNPPVLFSVSVNAFRWLVCRLLVDSSQRFQSQMKKGSDGFTTRNNRQVYFCRSLALAYIEVLTKQLKSTCVGPWPWLISRYLHNSLIY